MPMIFTNARASDHPVIFVNQAFLNMTGFEDDEVLGRPFGSLLEPASDPEALAEIETAYEGGRDLQTQIRCRRRDESFFWVTIFVSPVRDDEGRTIQHFASFVDVAHDKEEERRLRVLLDDLESQAQATLTSVQALAIETLQGLARPDVVAKFQRQFLMLRSAIDLHRLTGQSWASTEPKARPRDE